MRKVYLGFGLLIMTFVLIVLTPLMVMIDAVDTLSDCPTPMMCEVWSEHIQKIKSLFEG